MGIPADIPQRKHGEAGFDQQIGDLLFNKLPFDRAPDVVATPRTEDEVIAIVRTARAGGCNISVRSGGHSWIAAPVRNSGILIDMSAFDQIEVNGASRTARVGPAVKGRTLTETLASEGLAYPSGHCGTPGVGGYLLGGGIGLNTGHWNPACYSIRSARVVTPSGDLTVASESDRHDLLWLARGSGPYFPGIITEFELELQGRPDDTRVSSWLFDFNDLATVSRWISDISPTLPSNVSVFTAALGPDRPLNPPRDGFPNHVVAVNAIAYVHEAQEAREALAPMVDGCDLTPLSHSHLQPVPFEAVHQAFDVQYPEGHRYLADSFWTDQDVEGALLPLQDVFLRAPSGKNMVLAFMPGNGAKLGLSGKFGAYSMDERTLVMPYAVWTDGVSDDANRVWITEMANRLDPVSSGHFLSEADLEAHADRLARCFTPDNWERVISLRAQWDREGLFRDVPGHAV